MPKHYLTDTIVRKMNCPQNKDQEIFWDGPKTVDGKIRDGSIQGLGVRVTCQGKKTFIHAYRFDGKRYRYALGTPANMNIASARMLVSQREQQIFKGENPDAEKIDYRKKHLLTVREVIDQHWADRMVSKTRKYQNHYVLKIARWHKKPPTRQTKRGFNKQASYTDFGTLFSDREFSSIRPADIQRFLKQFSAPGTYNTARSLVTALFNWAIRMQLVDMRNPCDPIEKRQIIKQRRDYTEEQVARITQFIFNPVLDPLPAITGTGEEKKRTALAQGRMLVSNQQMEECCAFMGILFLTMARPNELMQAEFSHFDLKRLVWDKHNTKGIKLSGATYEYAYRSVPIHPRVATLVEQQKQRWPASRYVFPSHRDINQPRDNFKRQIEQFRQLESIPDTFQMYDLKRIAISLMLVGQGVRREDVSHYVDHKGNLETTMIYDLGFVEPLRPITDRLGQLLGVS